MTKSAWGSRSLHSRLSGIGASLKWSWDRWNGWKMEGMFPGAQDQAIVLCGKGLGPNDWHGKMLGLRWPWLRATATNLEKTGSIPHDGPHLIHGDTAADIQFAVDCSLRWKVPLHIAHRSEAHRRIRCNSAILVRNHPERTVNYAERILSQSMH